MSGLDVRSALRKAFSTLTSITVAAGLVAAIPGTVMAADEVTSTGTVVVASDQASIRNVGTTTITVSPGATAEAVLGGLAASDSSKQVRRIVDASGAPRTGGIETADRLEVTAEDGTTTGTYKFQVWDPASTAAEGVYWNQTRYNEIDSTVNANTPVFPNRVCDITDAAYAGLVRQATERYATGNEAGSAANRTSPLVYATQNVWYYGDAINAAIADCSNAGGGIVRIPSTGSKNPNGVYYSGAINLLNGVNLRLETGSTVKFMRERTNEYYPVVRTSYEGNDLYNFSPLIYAFHQENIAVTGGGTLDGQEDMWNWRPWKKGYWGEPNVSSTDLSASTGNNGIIKVQNGEGLPIEKRIYTADGSRPESITVFQDGKVTEIPTPQDATVMKSGFRPLFIAPYESKNLLIEGVKIRNTPFWTVNPVSCENVLIRDLDIYSNKNASGFEQNTWNNDDGLDPESGTNVVMERNTVTVSDDGVALKAGRDRDGREQRDPISGVIIRDSTFRNDGGNSAAVSAGSEMSGGVKDVFVHDIKTGGPGLVYAVKLKTNAWRGGAIDGFYMRNSVLEQTKIAMVSLEGDFFEEQALPQRDLYDPTIRNIYLDNVNTVPTVTPGKTTFNFEAASRSPIENVYYRNSTFHTTATLSKPFDANKFIKNFVVENVQYVNPTTNAITTYNTKSLELAGDARIVTGVGNDITATPDTITGPDVVTAVPASTFKLAGKLDISQFPNFASTGKARVFVDRNTNAVPVSVNADGTFLSDPITLGEPAYWYRDRHYVSLNFYGGGIDINTVVFPVAVVRTPTVATIDGPERVDVNGSGHITATFTNNAAAGAAPVTDVSLSLPVPAGWEARPQTETSFSAVAPGQTVTGQWRLVRNAEAAPGITPLSARADYQDPLNNLRLSSMSPQLTLTDILDIAPADVAVTKPSKLAGVRVGQQGVLHTVDRTNTLIEYPAALTGAVLIPGANDDKRLTSPADYLTFTLARPSTVYVAFDARGKGSWWPAWLTAGGFEATGLTAKANDGSSTLYNLFKKDYPAGQVVLGPNSGSSNDTASYFTIVAAYSAKQAGDPVQTETALTLSANEVYPTSEPIKAAITVSQPGGTPIYGTVTLRDGDATLAANVPVALDGRATVELPTGLTAGHHALTAEFVPEAPVESLASKSPPQTLLVHLNVEAGAALKCVGGSGMLTMSVTNKEKFPVKISMRTPYGTKTFDDAAEPGKTHVHPFNTRLKNVPAGEAQAVAVATVNGQEVLTRIAAPYPAATC